MNAIREMDRGESRPPRRMSRRRFDVRGAELPLPCKNGFAALAPRRAIVFRQSREAARTRTRDAQAMHRRYIDRHARLARQLKPLRVFGFTPGRPKRWESHAPSPACRFGV